jgi:glycogen operon protein
MFAAEAAPGELDCVYVAANAYWEDLEVGLPRPPHGYAWHLYADTATAGDGVGARGIGAHEPGDEPLLTDQDRVVVGSRSTVVLVARPGSPSSTFPEPRYS